MNPNVLYDILAAEDKQDKRFWGNVPKTFQNVVDQVKNKKTNASGDANRDYSKVKDLQQFLLKYHRNLGISSPKVEDNIDLLPKGSILMGQQPVVFGGPGFIGNKFGCLTFLDQLLKTSEIQLAPIFFIGDYDNLQKELTRAYFPNPISHQPFILESEEYLPEESSIAAHAAKLPPYSWLVDNLQKLDDNLRGFKKQVKGDKKKVFDERWEHIKTLLKVSFVRATTLSEWASILWGMLANIISDLGIIFLPTSHPEVRKLVYKEYIPLIKNRSVYAEQFQENINELTKLGYSPTLPHRHSNYSPFTLECEDDQNRIPTTIEQQNGSVVAQGECPVCKKHWFYDVSNEENLEKIFNIIGPRVDTSQAIFQNLLNIQVRISGPGEIAYYSLVAPSLRHIGFATPIFVKYKRAFYNSNALEKLGSLLSQRKQPSIHKEELFLVLRERTKAIKNQLQDDVIQSETSLRSFIEDQYEKLLASKQSIDISKYLGWQYGRFDSHKFGQEVSWSWFDLALYTGMNDYIPTYARMYSPLSSVGGYGFLNTLI